MKLMNSRHNLESMSRRGITQADIDFVAAHGRRIYRTGALFLFLGRHDIPRGFERSHGHLEGTTLIVAADRPVVITCYRNRNGSRQIKKKLKRAA